MFLPTRTASGYFMALFNLSIVASCLKSETSWEGKWTCYTPLTSVGPNLIIQELIPLLQENVTNCHNWHGRSRWTFSSQSILVFLQLTSTTLSFESIRTSPGQLRRDRVGS